MQKTSRRDLPAVIAGRLDGATTVSATMLLAARAGIPVFVTGGAPPALQKGCQRDTVGHVGEASLAVNTCESIKADRLDRE